VEFQEIGLTQSECPAAAERTRYVPAMSARGRLLSVLVTIVVALAGFVTVGALPAAAAPNAVQYVALGDSYAAGTAAGSFPNCPHSDIGYPELLDAEQRIHLRANPTCSGATTLSVATTQLSALNRGTRLVTVTVGAADLGLSRVLAACSPGPSDECQGAIDEALGLLVVPPGVLLGRLTDLYADIADAAPKARIVVTGYPLLFTPALTDPNLTLKLQINEATAALNATIRQAVIDTQSPNVDIVYVDVSGTPGFAGHGIGGTDPFINDLPDPNAFHPNADGYRTYADLISAVLQADG
jgi:lysophospholipase L1-like esterase